MTQRGVGTFLCQPECVVTDYVVIESNSIACVNKELLINHVILFCHRSHPERATDLRLKLLLIENKLKCHKRDQHYI